MPRFLAILLIFAVQPAVAAPPPLTVAVASNFLRTAEALAESFERETGTALRLVPGSTGRLYAQIVNGAPFDLFLAADRRRPAALVDTGLAAPDARLDLATGRVALVSFVSSTDDCLAALRDPASIVAIANPSTAPYGEAAVAWLDANDLLEAVGKRLAIGNNVAQALQFVTTGNARLGFVAAAQLDGLQPTCRVDLPASDLLTQQLVLLERAAGRHDARAFFHWLQGTSAGRLIAAHGYDLPARHE